MRHYFSNDLMGDYYQVIAHTARDMSIREIDIRKVTDFVNYRSPDNDLLVRHMFARDPEWSELREWCRLKFGWTMAEDLHRYSNTEEP